MSCFYLRPAWRREGGITFQKRGSQVEPDYQIPCGKCTGCAREKARDWAIRMAHESLYYDRNCFVTLTYREAPDQIEQQHIQRFIKRLRKKADIRYFVTGEYGERTKRPHYHAIIFGEDFRGGAFSINEQLYANKRLDRIWREGNVVLADFGFATAMYVAGYTNKKLGDPLTFSLMSRNPPIGWRFARDHQQELRNRETVIINGKEFPIPKVYFQWLTESKFRPGIVDLDTIDRRKHISEVSIEQARSMEINDAARLRLRKETL